MKTTLLCAMILLTGCGPDALSLQPQWACINGLTHELRHGAWVQLDGHEYVGLKDGPLYCADKP